MNTVARIVRSKALVARQRQPAWAGRAAQALGWFSIGLGIFELLAPHRLTASLGMRGRETLLRTYGLRELAAGAVTLLVSRPLGLWSRVAGDAVDATTILPALHRGNSRRGSALGALTMVLGITVLDIMAARAAGRGKG